MKYVFKCAMHGEFEVEQHMEDDHVALCPVCADYARRVYQPIPFKWRDGEELTSERI